MLTLSFILIILVWILNINNINAQNECMAVSKCYNDDPCSANGRCYYDFKKQIADRQPNKTINITYNESCICNPGYYSRLNQTIKCCYLQKNQLNAFLLEFFIGFGTGHFYIGNTNLALTKLLCNILFYCYCYLVALCIYVKDESEETHIIQKILNSFVIIVIFAFCAWWIVDLIFFGFNIYKDSNEIPLNSW